MNSRPRPKLTRRLRRRLFFELLERRELFAISILEISPDTGLSPDDGITSAPVVSVSGESEPDALVRIRDGNDEQLAEVLADNSGSWSVELSAELADGVYDLVAESFDSELLPLTSSDPRTLVLDRESPAAPIALTLTRLDPFFGVFDFEFTGSAEPGSNVTVSQVGGDDVGDATANASGNWSLLISNATLADNRFAYFATATDLAGNSSTASETKELLYAVSILGVSPDTGSSANDGVTAAAVVSVSGASEPDSLVRIRDGNDEPLAEVLVDSSGSWSVALPAELADGVYELVADSFYSELLLASSDPWTLTLDRESPAAPIASTLTRLAPSPGVFDFEFAGLAEPGTTVTVTQIGGSEVGDVTADASGNWSLLIANATFADHRFAYFATATDAAGNSSTASETKELSFEVSISGISPDTGSSPDDGVTSAPVVSVSGESEPDTLVRIRDGNDEQLAEVLVDSSGSWSVELPAELVDGVYELVADSFYSELLLASSEPWTLTLDRESPAAPIASSLTRIGASPGIFDLEFAGSAEPGATVTVTQIGGGDVDDVTADASGNWSLFIANATFADHRFAYFATATDTAGNSSAASETKELSFAVSISGISPDTGSSPDDGVTAALIVTVSGASEPNSLVRIRDGNDEPLAEVLADSSGSWSVQLPSELADGVYELVADSFDTGLLLASSDAWTLTLDRESPAAPIASTLTRLGSSPGVFDFEFAGTAEPATTVTVTQIGGGDVGDVTADASGNWSLLIASATPADRRFAYFATATDTAGNASAASETMELTFTVSISGVSPDTGSSPDDGITAALVVSVSGESEPDEIVRIHDGNDEQLAEVLADSSGSWSVELPSELADGVYELVAEIVDTESVPMASSDPWSLTLDREPPSAPVASTLTRLASSSGVFDFEIAGSAEPGSTVEVSQVGGGEIGDATADASGNWSLLITNATLIDHRFAYVATATDQAGNSSTASETKQFQPNIVFVFADDMRADELSFMPFTSSLAQSEATVFPNAFVPTALSGPSRASVLTGLSAARTGVLENAAPLGGGANFSPDSTIGNWMQDAGYKTGLFGKYRTNPGIDEEMPSQDIYESPPEWDTFFGITKPGFYRTEFSDNGTVFTSSDSEHQTDVIAERVSQFMQDSLSDETPFFAMVTPIAPHAPSIPATRHEGVYADVPLPNPPSFNIPEPDKLPLSDASVANIRAWQRGRWESLLGIDEAIQGWSDALEASGDLDNTIFIFSSDNSSMEGEHAHYSPSSKNVFYENAIHVPLFIWDGRARSSSTVDSLALSLDIAPTIAYFGGAVPAPDIDGKNLANVIDGIATDWRTDFLIHHVQLGMSGDPVTEFGVRNSQWIYVERSNGTKFLFDVVNDPWELNNLAGVPALSSIERTLALRLQELKPTDQTAPAIVSAVLVPTTEPFDTPQPLRLQVSISDASRGNAEIRTPELIFDTSVPISRGIPMDAADGRFDEVTESATIGIPLWQIAKSGVSSVHVRARDAVGNWSSETSVALPSWLPMELASESDTGTLHDDQITTDFTPRFYGIISPGSQVAVFAAKKDRTDFVNLGAVVADEFGSWSVTSSRLEAGEYVFYGQASSEGDSAISYLGPLAVRIIGSVTTAGTAVIAGNDADDRLRFETSSNSGNLFLNGEFVGSLAAFQSIEMSGGKGADELEVVGNIRATLRGDDGDDVLRGGSGDDSLIGGAGNNWLLGNAGGDRYVFRDLGLSNAKEILDRIDMIAEAPSGAPSIIDARANFLGIEANMSPFSAQPEVRLKTFSQIDRVIRFADAASALSIRRILGTNGSDTVMIPTATIFDGQRGDDIVRIAEPISPRAIVPVRSLAIGLAVPATTTVQANLSVNWGTLKVLANIPNPLDAPIITQNGTSSVTLAGTFAAINATLAASGGVVYTADATHTGTAEIVLSSFEVAAPAVVEQDRIRLTISYRPVLGLSGTSTYVENAAPVLIGSNATLVDGDGNLDGARLTIRSTGFSEPTDRIVVQPRLAAPGQVLVQSGQVSYDGNPVATISGTGLGSNSLVLTFGTSVTVAEAQAILRRIAFASSSDNPSPITRSIEFQIEDKTHFTSLARTRSVEVVPVNDVPRVTLAGTLLYTTGTRNARLLTTTSVVTDPEGNFAGGYLTLQFHGFSESSDRLDLLSNGNNPGQVSRVGDAIHFGGQVIGTVTSSGLGGAALRIDWNSSASAAGIQAVVRRLTYRTTSITPTTTQRRLDLELVDGAGGHSPVVVKFVQFT